MTRRESKTAKQKRGTFAEFDEDGAQPSGSSSVTIPSAARAFLRKVSRGTGGVLTQEPLAIGDSLCATHQPPTVASTAASSGQLASLLSAARCGDVRALMALEKGGADMNSYSVGGQDEDGSTALHLAAFHGHTGAVAWLLAHGANASAVDIHGFTAAHLAARNGHDEVLGALLSHGVSPFVESHTQASLVHMAAVGGHINVLPLLLHAGCTLGSTTTNGNTPLQVARQRGHSLFCNELEALVLAAASRAGPGARSNAMHDTHPSATVVATGPKARLAMPEAAPPTPPHNTAKQTKGPKPDL
eukprot:g405.t1